MLKKDEKNKQESTTKKEAKFQIPEEEKSSLPPFPNKDAKKGEYLTSSSPNGGKLEDEPDFSDVDLEEVCKDICSIPFEVWSILKPGVKPLTDTEKKLISKPMARVMLKYDVQKYAKDEFLLLGFLGFAVMKRVKDSKKVEDEKDKLD